MRLLKYILILLFFFTLFFDLQHYANDNDVTLLIILLLGFFLTYIYQLESRVTFIFSGFLLFVFCWQVVNKSDPILLGRITLWVYFFIVFGVIQQFFELKKKK